MMKKVILCTGFSLLVFSGFVAGPWGPNLAEAGNCLQPNSDSVGQFVYGPECFDKDVKAVITISKGHDIQIFSPTGKPHKKPKKQGGGDQTANPGPPEEVGLGELPSDLEDDVSSKNGKYKKSTIIVSGNGTCMTMNGTRYCWLP